jgi:hypothetical protein
MPFILGCCRPGPCMSSYRAGCRAVPGCLRRAQHAQARCTAAVHDAWLRLCAGFFSGMACHRIGCACNRGRWGWLGIRVPRNYCCRDGWGCLCNSLSGSTGVVMVCAAAYICGHTGVLPTSHLQHAVGCVGSSMRVWCGSGACADWVRLCVCAMQPVSHGCQMKTKGQVDPWPA